jgi:hypothetical protein
MSNVDWAHILETQFNQLVEALLVREYTGNGLVAQALDGRGGDGGIDVDVRSKKTDQLTRIFQLKYFPEGFSGGFVNRRSQIKESLTTAINEQKPPHWTLVTPRKVTSRERKAVRAMRDGHVVTVSFVGPPELDGLLAKHPDVERRFTTDSALELLTAVHRPEAALKNASDLAGEVSRLGEHADSRSEYWGTAFSRAPDGTITESVFAKRPDAAQREPLRINLTLQFSPDDQELRARFEGAMKFGMTEPIEVPDGVLKSFEKIGPDWFQALHQGGRLELGPTQGDLALKHVSVVLRDKNDNVISRLPGVVASIAGGYGGATLSVELDGGLTQHWLVPLALSDPGSINFTTHFAGHAAHEIRRAVRFINHLQNSCSVGVSIEGAEPMWVILQGNQGKIIDPTLAEFVDDLCILEEHFDVALRLPDGGGDLSDRIWARILVRLLNGEAVAHPDTGSFTATLTGSLESSMEDLLTSGAAILIRNEGFSIELFGEQFVLGEIAYYTHSAVIDGASEILEVLKSGNGVGQEISIRPIDDLPWVIYCPPLLEVATNTVITEPWDINGIPEHPKYAALPNSRANQ